MEDPATWGRAERVVAKALADADYANEVGLIGSSRVRRVTDALREAGLLRDGPVLPRQPEGGTGHCG